MKRIALLILAVVLVVGVLLTLNGDASAVKKKGKKTPQAGGVGATALTMADSRYYATIPNFTPAAGDYIIPNSDTVSSNFVLQGDNTGGATWVTIPVTEYEIDAKAGYIVKRVTDLVSGAGVDWDAYETANGGGGYRLSAYTKSVSGVRTAYTNQSVTFADTETGYSPIGQVGDINGAMLKNVITNLVIAAGGKVVASDLGLIVLADNGSYFLFRAADGETVASLVANKNTTNNTASWKVINVDGETANLTIGAQLDSNDALMAFHADDTDQYVTVSNGGGDLKGMIVGANQAPKAMIESLGGIGTATSAISSDTTLNFFHGTVLVDTTGGSVTLTLPAAASAAGRVYSIKKIVAANTVTVDADSSELIDGATTQALTAQWSFMTIQSNGSAWFIIAQ